MKISLVIVIPLGAGLLLLGSVASDPPGAVRRPAPLAMSPANDEAAVENQAIGVRQFADSAAAEPVEAAFPEPALLQGNVSERKAAIRELRRLPGDAAIAGLSFALADEDFRVRKAAAEALAAIGGDQALSALASAMRDGEAAARARAAESIAKAGGYSAVRYVELALRDEDPRVRATAIEALGDIGDSRAVNIISLALRDPVPEVRQQAAQILDELNDDALFQTLYPAQ